MRVTRTLREAHARIRRLLEISDDAPISLVGEGSDHWAFDVNGRFIARVRKGRDENTAAGIVREVALLDLVSRVSPVPVPELIAAEPEAGLAVFRRIPGISLFDGAPADPSAFAEPLAEFVASIHAVAPAAVEGLVGRDDHPLDASLSEAVDQMPRIARHLTSEERRRVERFLGSRVPDESPRRTFCHNDLGAEHVLVAVDGSALTGIIDWSDAAIADPARDIGRLLRDFGFGMAATVLRRTGSDDETLRRAVFHARCALLEDLAYGIEASQPKYVAHALGRFAETFS